jgi:hypothetical protein
MLLHGWCHFPNGSLTWPEIRIRSTSAASEEIPVIDEVLKD